MIYFFIIIMLPFFIHVLHFATQEGQIFGFWQKVLKFLYRHESTRHFEKFLGGCYLCFSNFISVLAIIAVWVLAGRPFGSIILSVFVCTFMVSTSVVLSVLLHGFINRILKKH